MASSQSVYIASGDQPRLFDFGNASAQVNSTTTVQNSLPIYKQSVFSTFQAILTGTSGLTGTVVIQCSNDDNTGRGFYLGGRTTAGAPVSTASSTTLTSAANDFTSALVGALVVGPGIPVGTTVASFVSPSSLTMSASATLTQTNVPVVFYALNWCATPLGTITLSGSTYASDGFTTTAPWRYVRAQVTAIGGVAATISVNMGV